MLNFIVNKLNNLCIKAFCGPSDNKSIDYIIHIMNICSQTCTQLIDYTLPLKGLASVRVLIVFEKYMLTKAAFI